MLLSSITKWSCGLFCWWNLPISHTQRIFSINVSNEKIEKFVVAREQKLELLEKAKLCTKYEKNMILAMLVLVNDREKKCEIWKWRSAVPNFLFEILNYFILLSYVKTVFSLLLYQLVLALTVLISSASQQVSGTNCTDILSFSASFGAFIIDISISLPFPAICKLIFLILMLQRMSRCVYELKNKSLDFGPSHLGYILFRKMTTCFGLRDCHQAIITKILKVRCSALQIKLVICEPMWLTEFI